MTVVKTNREQYQQAGTAPAGVASVRLVGKYYSPLIEKISLTAGTEDTVPLREGVGYVRIYSTPLLPFNVAYAPGETTTDYVRIGCGKEYIREHLQKIQGPDFLYVRADADSELTVETWLI